MWAAQLKGDPIPWLLENDTPGVRYLALRDLVVLPADNAELCAARTEAHRAARLRLYWITWRPRLLGRAGSGYNPKYQSTVWSLILLAELAPPSKPMTESARPAPICSTMPSRPVASSRPLAHLPARLTVCRATSVGRCWSLGY